MFVITTIYCTELDAVEQSRTEELEEESVINLDDADRELLGIHQGTTRTLPLDGER